MPADSSATIIRYLEETTPGTIESGNPQIWRITSGTLDQSIETNENTELRADRGRGDTTVVSGSVAGAFNIDLSHKTHDDFLEALLANTYDEVDTDGIIVVADMAFDSSTDIISSATTALPVLEKGQWFQISGANESTNDGIYKASSTVAPTTAAIAVDTAVKEVAVTDTAQSTSLSSSRLKQGSDDQRTFTIEREMSDVSQFLTWPYQQPSSLSLSYANGDRVNGSIGFMGAEVEDINTSSQFPGIATAVAATTTSRFNVITGTSVLIDGIDMGESCVQDFTLDVQAGIRERKCLTGGIAASSLAEDQFTITGTSTIFFGSSATAALYQKKLSDLPITFAVCVSDPQGNAFALTFYRAKITEATIDNGGLGSDVIMSFNFSSSSDNADHPTLLAIDRLGTVA